MEIKSNSTEAQLAINLLLGVDISDRNYKQIDFSYTRDISGMENGKRISNKMMQGISECVEAILIQAKKIPQIAESIESLDIETAKKWEE